MICWLGERTNHRYRIQRFIVTTQRGLGGANACNQQIVRQVGQKMGHFQRPARGGDLLSHRSPRAFRGKHLSRQQQRKTHDRRHPGEGIHAEQPIACQAPLDHRHERGYRLELTPSPAAAQLEVVGHGHVGAIQTMRNPGQLRRRHGGET